MIQKFIGRIVPDGTHCHHCGGDKPWAWKHWWTVGKSFFCCYYCATVYGESALRDALRRKRR